MSLKLATWLHSRSAVTSRLLVSCPHVPTFPVRPRRLIESQNEVSEGWPRMGPVSCTLFVLSHFAWESRKGPPAPALEQGGGLRSQEDSLKGLWQCSQDHGCPWVPFRQTGVLWLPNTLKENRLCKRLPCASVSLPSTGMTRAPARWVFVRT